MAPAAGAALSGGLLALGAQSLFGLLRPPAPPAPPVPLPAPEPSEPLCACAAGVGPAVVAAPVLGAEFSKSFEARTYLLAAAGAAVGEVRGLGAALGTAAFVLLDLFIIAPFVARSLRRRLAAASARGRQRGLAAGCAEFPELERALGSCDVSAATGALSSRLSAAATVLAAAFNKAGEELERGLPSGDDHAAAELLNLWRQLGEASIVFGQRMEELAGSLQTAAKDADCERQQILLEAHNFLGANAQAKAGARCCGKQSRRGLERLEAWQASVPQELSRLVERAEALQRRSSQALGHNEAEAKRQAAALGAKLLAFQPGAAGAASRRGQHVDGIIKSISTEAGRQRLRAAEKACKVELPEQTQSFSMHAEKLTCGGWRVCGQYEHQALKVGLRVLDRDWPADRLLDFPPGLFRENHVKELLSGGLRLQSMLGNDVAAAQRDMQKLSLRQLLRLRVRHIDFVPSGCGSNTVTGVGDTHEALLSLVDRLLFQKLGREAVRQWAPAGSFSDGEAHRFGRQAVLFMAAATAVTEPAWWVWWITEETRLFFHPVDFKATEYFPDGGVLEVADHTKADKNDPTGHFRFLDWRASLVTSSEALQAKPTIPPEPEAPAAGGAIAPKLSPELLKDQRSALRRTSSVQ